MTTRKSILTPQLFKNIGRIVLGAFILGAGISHLSFSRQEFTAAFFVAVFPGNIAQWANQRDGFGLDTDSARLIRLFFQPVLIALALWSTNAWTKKGLNPPIN